MNRKQPARLYPKKEQRIGEKEIMTLLFLSALIVSFVIAVALAVASKSFYYTPLA